MGPVHSSATQCLSSLEGSSCSPVATSSIRHHQSLGNLLSTKDSGKNCGDGDPPRSVPNETLLPVPIPNCSSELSIMETPSSPALSSSSPFTMSRHGFINVKKHRAQGQLMSPLATVKALPSPSTVLGQYAYHIWLTADAGCDVVSEYSSVITRPADEETLCFKNILSVMDKSSEIRAVHPSLLAKLGQEKNFCFRITKLRSSPMSMSNGSIAQTAHGNSEPFGITRYYSTKSFHDQVAWMLLLRRAINPDYDRKIRVEESLRLWIQEVKHVPPKKRYHCEVRLDDLLYAKTNPKVMTDMLLWAEEIHLRDLPKCKMLTLSLKMASKNADREQMKPSTCIGHIRVPVTKLRSLHSEQWYPVEPSDHDIPNLGSQTRRPSEEDPAGPTIMTPRGHSRSQSVPFANYQPSTPTTPVNHSSKPALVRLRAHWRSVRILPEACTAPLRQFLGHKSAALIKSLESVGLRVSPMEQEAFSQSLVKVLHLQGNIVPYLVEALMNDISRTKQETVTLRGNSFASKSMECYLLLIGQRYLQTTLREFIQSVLNSNESCEVDPIRIPGTLGSNTHQNELNGHRRTLRNLVDTVWNQIRTRPHALPKELRLTFAGLREQSTLTPASTQPRGSMSVQRSRNRQCSFQVISACLFLRLLCPAILSPSMFGLLDHYPDQANVNRTLTLVAKTIQSLANETLFGHKESYMLFLNDYLKERLEKMRTFLMAVSSSPAVTVGHSAELDAWNEEDGALLSMRIDEGYELALLEMTLMQWLGSLPQEKIQGPLHELATILKSQQQCHKQRCNCTPATRITRPIAIPSTLNRPSPPISNSSLPSKCAVASPFDNADSIACSLSTNPPQSFDMNQQVTEYDEPCRSPLEPHEVESAQDASACQHKEREQALLQKIHQIQAENLTESQKLQDWRKRFDRLQCENLHQVHRCRQQLASASLSNEATHRLNRIEREATRHICIAPTTFS